MRAYRPGRRAVLRIDGDGPRRYAKVVWPSAVAKLRRRHDLLAPQLPVPSVLAASSDGLLLLPEVAGTPLRTLLARDAPVPAPATLDALLDGLPDDLLRLPARRTHLQRVGHFAAVLALTALTAPEDRARVDALAGRLAAIDPGAHPTVPVHGDLHKGQLLADAASGPSPGCSTSTRQARDTGSTSGPRC